MFMVVVGGVCISGSKNGSGIDSSSRGIVFVVVVGGVCISGSKNGSGIVAVVV